MSNVQRKTESTALTTELETTAVELPQLVKQLIAALDNLTSGVDAKGKCYLQACSGLLKGLNDGTFETLTSDHIHTIAAAAGAIEEAFNKGNFPGTNYYDISRFELARNIMNEALPQLCSHYGQMVGQERPLSASQRIRKQHTR